jgi:large subunit ribosomal protein L21
MYAVIRTGGKQYTVAPNDILDIEKIAGENGEIVEFTDVLMIGGDGEPVIGAPLVAGATVAAEIVRQHRGDKVIIVKKRRRKNSRRRTGHRQYLSEVRITEILTGGTKAAGVKAKPATAEAAPAKPKAEKTEKADKGEAKAKPAKKSAKSE